MDACASKERRKVILSVNGYFSKHEIPRCYINCLAFLLYAVILSIIKVNSKVLSSFFFFWIIYEVHELRIG